MDDRGFILDDDAGAEDVYSKLEGDEIRVLLLPPAKKGSTLIGELQVVPAPQAEQYEALSYVWGDSHMSRLIKCNGYNFRITESLYTALMHLRYETTWRRLWVDQLCINQEHEHELLSQVGAMGNIYSSAVRVVVWLGSYNKKMAAAWSLLQETSLSSSLVQSDFLGGESSSSNNVRPQLDSRRTSSRSSLGKYSSRANASRESLASSTSSLGSISKRSKRKRPEAGSAVKNALAIFQHVWFQRKWTFQEIILAKSAIICCGDLEMAWGDLKLWYFHYSSKLRELYDSHGSFENIMNVQNDVNKGRIRASELLMLTRSRQSLLGEDAVYALLGLLPAMAKYLQQRSKSDENVKLDEEARLFHLYLRTFEYCLETENDLTILSAAGQYKGNGSAHHFPSWLPDWRQPLPLRPLVLSVPPALGPESAFDEELEDEPGALVAFEPPPPPKGLLYRLNPPSPQYTMTVHGVRLGCLATRPSAWPRAFLVADSAAQNFLEAEFHSSTPKLSRSTSSLVSEGSQPLPASLRSLHKTSGSGSTNTYADALLRRSLSDGTECEPVHTFATVEAGDWLVALRGGAVLYVVRPLESPPARTKPTQGGLRGWKRSSAWGSHNTGAARESARPVAPTDTLPEVGMYRCVFVGEASVRGLSPAEIMARYSPDAAAGPRDEDSGQPDLLDFELV